MIGIIGATPAEITSFVNMMSDVKIIKHGNVDFHVGKLSNKEVCLALSGVGKVEASRVTTLMLDHFEIDHIFNIGIAGGNSQYIKKRSIVVADRVFYSDMDTRGFDPNRPFGFILGIPYPFECDKETIDKIAKSNSLVNIGTILTGDQFVNGQEMTQEKLSHYPEEKVLAFEMEAAAICHVCYLNNVKVNILRYISDVTDKSLVYDDYFGNKDLSSYALIEIIKDYLQ